jgi:hypothetical protein
LAENRNFRPVNCKFRDGFNVAAFRDAWNFYAFLAKKGPQPIVSASEIQMKTKMGTQNVSGRQVSGPPSAAPEIALIAILTAVVLLRILDICSPPAVENPDCTPTLANEAVISCAIRPDQNRNALSRQSVASLNSR